MQGNAMEAGEDDRAAPARALAERVSEAMFDGDAASRHLGMEITHIAPGEATLAMTVRAEMLNGHGICHGGYMFLLADSAFAFACNSYNRSAVAAHADISFLRGVSPGEVLTARAFEVHREGRNGVYDVEVTGRDGVRVALFRGKSRTIRGSFVPETNDGGEA